MADDSGEIVREGAESAAFANVKTLGEVTAFLTANLMQEVNANQSAINALRLAVVAKGVDAVLQQQPQEGVTDTALAQQLMKGAQTTPPVTSG